MKRSTFNENRDWHESKRRCVRQIYERICNWHRTESFVWNNFLTTEYNVVEPELMLWQIKETSPNDPQCAYLGTASKIYAEVNTALAHVSIYTGAISMTIFPDTNIFPHRELNQESLCQVILQPSFLKHFSVSDWRRMMIINRKTYQAMLSDKSPYSVLAAKLRPYMQLMPVGSKPATGLWTLINPHRLVYCLNTASVTRQQFYILMRESPKFCELVIRHLPFFHPLMREDQAVHKRENTSVPDRFKFEVVAGINNRINGFDTMVITTSFLNKQREYVFLTGGLFISTNSKYHRDKPPRITDGQIRLTARKVLNDLYHKTK